MVLTMHSHPLVGIHAGRQPQPEPEEMLQCRVQIDGAMGLIAMQVEGNGHHGNHEHTDGQADILPKFQIEQTVNEVFHTCTELCFSP